MNLTIAIRELHPRRAFRIARPRVGGVRNVFARLEFGGFIGYGEASPNAFYGESADGVAQKLAGATGALRDLTISGIPDIESAWNEFWPVLAPSRAAQCALDLALWDWLGKSQGRSVSELVWGAPAQPVVSFATIGLSAPEELDEKIDELREYPRIKIKADETVNLEPVRRTRQHSAALLAVDANCAWNTVDLPPLVAKLADLGVTFVEQPFAPQNDVRLGRGRFALPVLADESSVTEDDVDGVARHFDGFNIKLVKCGGLTPALRMIRRGRESGCQLMVGSMLESSLLIGAGAVAAQRTDYADLDGAWLISDDPCDGWKFEQGTLLPNNRNGFGAVPEPSLFANAEA
jgi:L-alanine-DL-glutamate epimerase-like enolase superfamily enzyme